MLPTLDQYYVLTSNPKLAEIIDWLDLHGEWYEVHLNRTRFTLTPGRTKTEFLLRYNDCVDIVDHYEYIAPEEC